MYQGDNRGSSGSFKYYFDKELSKKVDSAARDSIQLKIYDGDRLIRTLDSKVPKETGIYEWSWRMDEKGGNYPSRNVNSSKRENRAV